MAKSKKMTMTAPTPQAVNPTEKEPLHEDHYEVKSALDDIERAEMHKANPELMKHVAKRAGRKVKALNGIAKSMPIESIDDLRKAKSKQFPPKE